MRCSLVSLLLSGILAVSTSSAQEQAKPAEVSIVGEVIDVKCFTTGMQGGRGPEHEDCAIACIKGGLPVGILDEKSGNLYTVVPAKGMKGANEALLPFVAKRVKIQGKLLEKAGTTILAYSSVEEVK